MRARIVTAMMAAAALLSACAPKRPVHPTFGPPGADAREQAREQTLCDVSLLEVTRPTTPDGFAKWLKDPEPTIRATAARALGRTGEALAWAGGDATPFVDALLPLAADPSADVRHQIASALGLIGAAASGKIEAPFAAETSPEIRARWVRAAGRIAPLVAGSNGTPSPELSLLRGALDDDATADAAGWAVGIWAYRRDRAGATVKAPAELVTAVRLRFQGVAGEGRRPFAYALWRLHESGTEMDLRNGLSDPDPRVRAWCARGLGDAKASGHEQVARLLGDPNVATRVEAARGLAKLSDADESDALKLVDLLESSDPPSDADRSLGNASPPAATAACDALGALGFRATAVPLRARLASDDPMIFASAATAYVKVAKADAVQDLADELGDRADPDDWRFRAAIAAALDGLAAPAKADEKPKPGTGSPKSPWLDAAQPVLDALLADGDPRVRAVALDTYADLGAADAHERLVAALDTSGDVSVLSVAADQLAKRGDPADGSKLARRFGVLVDSQPDLAAGILDDAVTLSGDALVPLLQKAATSPNDALMLAADKALRARGLAPSPRTAAPTGVPTAEQWLEASDLHRMTIRTAKGEIVVELEPEIAPITVWRFATLARAGFFDGIAFHRVVPAFVAQGGDPHGDGNGGPDTTMPCELSDEPYDVGTVGMALSGRDTGGSQFFFTLTPQPHLESNYTVFGHVVHGQDVVDRLTIGDVIQSLEVK